MNIAASITPNKTVFGPLLFAGELEAGLSCLAEQGYDGVELSLRTKDDVDRRSFNDRLGALGLELFSIATGQSYLEDGLSLFSTDESVRDATVKRLEDHIDFASDWKACVIVGGIRGKLERVGNASQFEAGSRAIDRCVEYAEKKDATILLEAINRYETNVFNTLAELREFMKARSPGNFLMLPDTFHMNIEEANIERSLLENKERIGAIHFADSNRLAPGMGHVDFGSIVRTIRDFPHIHYIGVEVLPLPSSTASAEKAIATIRSAMKERT